MAMSLSPGAEPYIIARSAGDLVAGSVVLSGRVVDRPVLPAMWLSPRGEKDRGIRREHLLSPGALTAPSANAAAAAWDVIRVLSSLCNTFPPRNRRASLFLRYRRGHSLEMCYCAGPVRGDGNGFQLHAVTVARNAEPPLDNLIARSLQLNELGAVEIHRHF